jgi:hypothetical protein
MVQGKEAVFVPQTQSAQPHKLVRFVGCEQQKRWHYWALCPHPTYTLKRNVLWSFCFSPLMERSISFIISVSNKHHDLSSFRFRNFHPFPSRRTTGSSQLEQCRASLTTIMIAIVAAKRSDPSHHRITLPKHTASKHGRQANSVYGAA